MAQTTEESTTPRLVTGTLDLGNGRTVDILLKEHTYKSGNTGWFGTIPRFALGDFMYGGQIQVFRMDRKQDKQ